MTNTTQSNDLRFSTSKTVGKKTIYVKIRLNDECKKDFSITGDIYEAGKPKTDRYFITGGCIHEDILKHFPEFKIFVNLHLCDYSGIPMYAVENGFYHLKEGFNNTKPSDKNFKKEFCSHYRITPKQFEVLNTSNNQSQYALNIQKLGILTQWKTEALRAIKLLEEMTGNKFVVDSKRTQFNAPTAKQIQEENKKIKSGYYTPKAVEKRVQAVKDKEIHDLKKEAKKEIGKINEELTIKIYVLSKGLSIDNFIFYNHSKEAVFNWSDATYYKSITKEEFDRFMKNSDLPKNVTFKFGKGK